jgi:hypothetical protein
MCDNFELLSNIRGHPSNMDIRGKHVCRSLVFKIAALLCAVLFIAGCGGGVMSPGTTPAGASPSTSPPPAGPNEFSFASYT